MKKIIFPFLALLLIAGSSCQGIIDIEKEKAAIKAAIEEEANAYRSGDIDRYTKCFVKDETTTLLRPATSLQIGWRELSEYYNERIKVMAGSTVRAKDFHFKNIKVYEDVAWAVFEERFADENDSIRRGARQVKILEKVDDEWKIALICTFGAVDATGWE